MACQRTPSKSLSSCFPCAIIIQKFPLLASETTKQKAPKHSPLCGLPKMACVANYFIYARYLRQAGKSLSKQQYPLCLSKQVLTQDFVLLPSIALRVSIKLDPFFPFQTRFACLIPFFHADIAAAQSLFGCVRFCRIKGTTGTCR